MESRDLATAEGRRRLKLSMPRVLLDRVHTDECRVLPNRDTLLRLLPTGGVAAEIGVANGKFTASILRYNAPRQLHLIDAWETVRYKSGLDEVSATFAADIKNRRVVLHRGNSTDQLFGFADGFFDWVYIDTNHSYETTFAELEVAHLKVRPDGFIAGHDFCTGNVIAPVPYGVIEACSKFCVQYGWKYRYLTLESHGHFSFALSRLDPGAVTGRALVAEAQDRDRDLGPLVVEALDRREAGPAKPAPVVHALHVPPGAAESRAGAGEPPDTDPDEAVPIASVQEGKAPDGSGSAGGGEAPVA